MKGTTVYHARRRAGAENLTRLESNLRRCEGALLHLSDMGLSPATIRKFRLGIKEPYRRRGDGKVVARALCFPLLSSEAEPLGRYACLNVPGVTENPPDDRGWAPGSPTTYYSVPAEGKRFLFLADSCYELWALDQRFAGSVMEGNFVIITSSHHGRIPDEWRSPEFWARWAAVYFGHEVSECGERKARELARLCGREARRVRVPEGAGRDWADFFRRGNTLERFMELVRDALPVSDPAPASEAPPDRLGEFAVNPVNINNAFANGHLYYPFTVERREVEKTERRGGVSDSRVVTSYVTKILRSDGAVLDVVTLAAPRGTPREKRVLALTDGTRVEREPRPTHYATWRLESLQKYIRARQEGRPAPRRPLAKILSDVASHLRRSVWLPFEEDYTLLTLYVALSFVYQVFEAVPLLLVCGEKGTGKSELGYALARVSCNATIIGQGSSAGVVRLLNEARGLVVLDDLESVGRSLREASFGDVSQMLKLGYKKSTGRRAITDKSGKTVVFDFYGPKVINNTRGVDPVLGSRVIHVWTRRIPDAVSGGALTGSEPEELARLRDELHVWGMADARLVHERYTRLMDAKGDRIKEIFAPLRAIADLSDGGTRSSLELALGRQHAGRRKIETPAELLKEAAKNCVRRGATAKLSAAQLSLELALVADQYHFERPAGAPWQKPEWVGHQLRSLRIREARLKVGRVRLYGVITRIYDLNADFVRSVAADLEKAGNQPPEQRHPLAFCEQTGCSGCPYDRLCSATVRGLKEGKALNRGRSGRSDFIKV